MINIHPMSFVYVAWKMESWNTTKLLRWTNKSLATNYNIYNTYVYNT